MSRAINRLPCVFSAALLARAAACEMARRRNADETEAMGCASPLARAGCAELYGRLRFNSTFVLRLKHTGGTLPHAAVMRIQCGGLEGVRKAIDPEAHAPDVHRLVRAAAALPGGIDGLPYDLVVQSIAAWRGRPRRA